MLRWLKGKNGERVLQYGRTMQTIAGGTYTEWRDVPEVSPDGQEPSLREMLAVAICQADNKSVPDGYGSEIDHPDVSDWGVFLADAVISALSNRAQR